MTAGVEWKDDDMYGAMCGRLLWWNGWKMKVGVVQY